MSVMLSSRKATLFAVCVACAVSLAGCGSAPKDKTAGMSVEKLYEDAKDDAATGNLEQAIKSFERLEGRAAGTLISQQAQLELAYLHYRTNDRPQAVAVLDRFMKLHPTSPAFDYALYLKGLVNFNDNLGFLGNLSRQNLSERDQQASRDSYQAFRQLVERYPQSSYAADATVRMNYIVNSLATYELHVARYYFRRGAYVAAANRAQFAVQEYQQTPAVEEALYLLVRCYEALDLPQLRDDAERVLKHNYPESRFLNGGPAADDDPWWQLW
jgi:outer membrane protein assembly factor BamD